MIQKNIWKATWKSKILKNKSKDRESNFLVVFSSTKTERAIERRRDDSLMLTTIRDDTWNVLNMQHITPNSKRWDYSDIPGGGHNTLKDPPTWLKVATTLEKSPTHKISAGCKLCIYRSGHGGATVLLPGFAISWQQHLQDPTHIIAKKIRKSFDSPVATGVTSILHQNSCMCKATSNLLIPFLLSDFYYYYILCSGKKEQCDVTNCWTSCKNIRIHYTLMW